MKKFNEMTKEELYKAMQELLGDARKKEQAGFYSEANVLEQKYYLAKSYLLSPQEIKIGGRYYVAGEDKPLVVEYLNGVFAWGSLEGETEEKGFPIGRLEPL